MTLTVFIDHREQKLKELFTSAQVPFEATVLTHGDIMITLNDQEIFVAERKTCEDLEASIKDGRYRNQKMELMAKYDRNKIYYIIEGRIGWAKAAPMLIGGCINTLIRDDLKIIQTCDVTDTFSLLCEIIKRLEKLQGDASAPPPEVKEVRTLKVASPYVAMLCQVPGVSMKTAQAISKRFANLGELGNPENLKVLKDTKIDNRKISKTVIQNIYNVFGRDPLQ